MVADPLHFHSTTATVFVIIKSDLRYSTKYMSLCRNTVYMNMPMIDNNVLYLNDIQYPPKRSKL